MTTNVMIEIIFHITQILVFALGWGYTLFKGGQWVGSINTTLAASIKAQEDHKAEDKRLFTTHAEAINRLQVASAVTKTKLANMECDGRS